MLTDAKLLWTGDSAGTSRDITPAGQDGTLIRGVFFRDAQYGWAIALVGESEAGTELNVYRTTDGGSNWSSALLTAPAGATGPAYVHFVDAQRGWLLIRVESSSNFSFGELYRTEDGGISWTQQSAPSGGEIRFVTASLGFMIGGPIRDRLYVTRDGGTSWQEQTFPPPSSELPAYSLPTFTDAVTGVLPFTLPGDAPTLTFYRTSDGGLSWTLGSVVQIGEELEAGVVVPNDVVSANNWVLAYPSSGAVKTTQDGGQNWSTITPQGLPSGVTKVDFANASHGWSLIESGTCEPDKITCTSVREASWTTNGGQTWASIGS